MRTRNTQNTTNTTKYQRIISWNAILMRYIFRLRLTPFPLPSLSFLVYGTRLNAALALYCEELGARVHVLFLGLCSFAGLRVCVFFIPLLEIIPANIYSWTKNEWKCKERENVVFRCVLRTFASAARLMCACTKSYLFSFVVVAVVVRRSRPGRRRKCWRCRLSFADVVVVVVVLLLGYTKHSRQFVFTIQR